MNIDITLIRDFVIPIAGVIVSISVYLIYREQTKVFKKQTLLQEKISSTNEKQYELNKLQVEYYEKQLALQELEFLPRILIKTQIASWENNKTNDTMILEISNDGYYISDYDSDTLSFYYFEIYDCKLGTRKCYKIPVNGYFACGSKPNNKVNQKGVLETRYDRNNNLHFNNIYKETLNHNSDDFIFNIYVFSVLKTTYKDYAGKNLEKYYKIAGDNFEISENDYKIEISIEKEFYPVEYSNLTFDKVIEITKKIDNTTRNKSHGGNKV